MGFCLHHSSRSTPRQLSVPVKSDNITNSGKAVRVAVPHDVGSPTGRQDDSLWWTFESLHRALLGADTRQLSEYRSDRDRVQALGLLAGAPAILGAFIGASAYDSSLAAFMFGLGAGAIAQVIVQQACRLRYEQNIDHVGLCGGVFQNRVLTELAIDGLTRRGFRVHLPEQLPANDAALCFGQAAHVAARNSRS